MTSLPFIVLFIQFYSVYSWSNSTWNCSAPIILTPTEEKQTWGQPGSGYPDNSTCKFFVRNDNGLISFKIIIDDGSPNHLALMTLFYNPSLSDQLRLNDSKGSNYVLPNSNNVNYVFGGNYSMVLKTNHTTEGQLYFEYQAVELSETNSTTETVTVTVDCFQIIFLAPTDIDSPEDRRLIWFAFVFPEITEMNPTTSATFFYQNDNNGEYLGTLYDFYEDLLNITEEPYKALMYTDYEYLRQKGLEYEQEDYNLLVVPMSVINQYSSYKYRSLVEFDYCWTTGIDINGDKSAPSAVFISGSFVIKDITFSNSSQWLEWHAGPGENSTPTMTFYPNDTIKNTIYLAAGGNTLAAYEGMVSLYGYSLGSANSDNRSIGAQEKYVITTPYYGLYGMNHSFIWNFEANPASPLDIYVVSVNCDEEFVFILLDSKITLKENDTLPMYHVYNFSIKYNNKLAGMGGRLVFTTSSALLPNFTNNSLPSSSHLRLKIFLIYFFSILYLLK